MLVPIRCGNSNRADLEAIKDSLVNSRGSAVTKETDSIVYLECVAHARAIYYIWAINQILKNQFDPNKMSVFLDRWQKILNLYPLSSNLTVTQQRAQIEAKLSIFNRNPTYQQVSDVMNLFLGEVFLTVSNITAPESMLSFLPDGALTITDGETCNDGSSLGAGYGWSSDVASCIVETVNPGISASEYTNARNQIFNLLDTYLPSWVSVGYAVNVGFSDDGYAGGPGYRATVSTVSGSHTITGVGTSWLTPQSDGTFNVKSGSILEFWDDNHQFKKYTVASVNSNTSITTVQATTQATNQEYLIYGFFLDCDASSFPYPPSGALNLDAAPFSE